MCPVVMGRLSRQETGKLLGYTSGCANCHFFILHPTFAVTGGEATIFEPCLQETSVLYLLAPKSIQVIFLTVTGTQFLPTASTIRGLGKYWPGESQSLQLRI